MSHQYRHRSPFHLRIPAEPPEVPLVIVDGPSPLGTAASTFIALGLLGAAGTVHATSVAGLRPHLRSRRLPTLAELADALRRQGAGWPAFDVVGVGIGALVGLRLALDGGPVRRVVAVDAPVPTYSASEVLATERFFTEAPRRPLARSLRGGGQQMLVLDAPDHGGALPVGMDPSWFRRPLEHGPGRWQREPIPAIPDSELTRVERPVLCINSPRSSIVTGGDHVARLVPTSKLLRLSTMDPADEGEQARVADALADFLHAAVPEGPAYRAARPAGLAMGTAAPRSFAVDHALMAASEAAGALSP
jgi:pimeloyl-ACP methyl ester carboxylesterase